MTFPCTLRFEPDTAKGPGHGLLLATCPGLSGNGSALLLLIRNASGSSIGPNGWQTGDTWLTPDAVQASGDSLLVSIGPAIVNCLTEPTCQIILFIDMEHVWQGVLTIALPTPPIPSAAPVDLLPDMEPARREAPREKPHTAIQRPSLSLSLSPEEPTASAAPSSEFLVMAERPKRYWGAIFNVFFAILTVALLGAAGLFFYHEVLPKTQVEPEEAPVEILKQEAADVKPGTEVPVTYAPEDLKGARGMSVARDAIKRKIAPETAIALARQLLAAKGDLKAQDGGRLILEDLAPKNNAQALLLLGDVYSPSQASCGTIQKNKAFATDCYKKALAAGAPEAQKRLEQLK